MATTTVYDATPTYTTSDPTGGSYVDNQGGASGSDGNAWALSKGAIVAISVVVGVVAAFGIASTILWYIAKKRNWEVRKSITRISRRLTGRKDNVEEERQALRQSRRQGVMTLAGSASELEKGLNKKPVKAMENELPDGHAKKGFKAVMPPSWQRTRK